MSKKTDKEVMTWDEIIPIDYDCMSVRLKKTPNGTAEAHLVFEDGKYVEIQQKGYGADFAAAVWSLSCFINDEVWSKEEEVRTLAVIHHLVESITISAKKD